ncbi:ribonucleotide-diphosphate reductase subunit beta [Haladaptatus sp. NG-SE-30]
MQLDHAARSFRYYRNAVERHWDPHDIDLSDDAGVVAEMDDDAVFGLKQSLARFGAGEQAVTEDLAPLAVVLDDVEDQLFVTTQLYEEAKHTDFFDRYWSDVINVAEDRRRETRSSPTEDRWFNEEYLDLFERNEAAMVRLLDDDTPENRAVAYCHYHLTIEGILAQTGYYGLTRAYGGDTYPDIPTLPGLTGGLTKIRGDEGRHVGFGMAKLKKLVTSGAVDTELVRTTIDELLPLVQATIPERNEGAPGPTPTELVSYAAEKHGQRMEQITTGSEEIPSVEELTSID